MNIAYRLKEERKKLHIKQKELSSILNITSQTMLRYEKGEIGISSELLEKLAPLGFDIQYIVTGVRSNSAPLTEEEKRLVSLYNSANSSIKLAVMAILQTGVQSGHVVNVQGNIADNINVNVE